MVMMSFPSNETLTKEVTEVFVKANSMPFFYNLHTHTYHLSFTFSPVSADRSLLHFSFSFFIPVTFQSLPRPFCRASHWEHDAPVISLVSLVSKEELYEKA